VKKEFNYGFLSNNRFYEDRNSLERFLNYCDRQCVSSDDISIFLTKTDIYFLLEVKIADS